MRIPVLFLALSRIPTTTRQHPFSELTTTPSCRPIFFHAVNRNPSAVWRPTWPEDQGKDGRRPFVPHHHSTGCLLPDSGGTRSPKISRHYPPAFAQVLAGEARMHAYRIHDHKRSVLPCVASHHTYSYESMCCPSMAFTQLMVTVPEPPVVTTTGNPITDQKGPVELPSDSKVEKLEGTKVRTDLSVCMRHHGRCFIFCSLSSLLQLRLCPNRLLRRPWSSRARFPRMPLNVDANSPFPRG